MPEKQERVRKLYDTELVADLRIEARGTEYPDSARTARWAADEIERLGAEVERLTAERDAYASAALAGLSGLVGTPERGYVADGGPGQLAADFRALRRRFRGLANAVEGFMGHAEKCEDLLGRDDEP